MSTKRERVVRLEERRTGFFGFYLVLGMVLLAAGVTSFTYSPGAAAIVIAAGAFFLRTGRMLAGTKRTAMKLAISAEAVELFATEDATLEDARHTRLPRARIDSGAFIPTMGTGRGQVVLLGKQGETLLAVEVDDAATGAEILEELGLNATAHRATFEGVFPLGRAARVLSFLGAIGAGGGILALGGGPIPLLVLLLFVALLFAWPSTIEIAADGVLVKTLLGARLVRFRDVVAIEPGRGVVTAWLVLRDGRRVAVPGVARPKGTAAGVHEEHSTVLRERLQNAWIAQRGGGDRLAAAAMARGGRSTAAWIDALRALRAGADYRAAAIPEETLAAVVEDAGAPDDARVAAAYVLGRSDEPVRARVRVAAESSASPRLRVALSAATEDDAEAAERALAEIAEENAAPAISAARRSP